ncbi:flagellar protein [Rhizobium tropici]|uniref:Flagellar protein n=1 Tax=Rhizobium tropici TaxID=398 RepID=A0A5B0WG29_RHITR|nr:MotE family protein [Rhizobium tropici]KAA1185913.1 flagellar protein [Rhizobium tropici]
MILTVIARRMLVACSLATGAMVLVPIGMAAAQEARQPADPASSQDEIRQFCTNIADPARDQRYLLQKQELEQLRTDIDQRIATMDKRKAEYEDWLKRRDDFLKTADLGLVDIYKNMKPDAAAASLNDVKTTIAAAIIMKLSSRQSSLILAEMDAKKAAVITNIIASASDPNTSKSKDPS